MACNYAVSGVAEIRGCYLMKKANSEIILSALMTSETRQAAAEKAGISDRTLRTYLSDPDFIVRYQRQRTKLLSDATRQLQSNLQTTIKTLVGIIKSKDSSDKAKISASRLILEYGLRFTEITDLVSRIESLERVTDE